MQLGGTALVMAPLVGMLGPLTHFEIANQDGDAAVSASSVDPMPKAAVIPVGAAAVGERATNGEA